jgi:2-dehydro-3-deoxyphosphogluconate aldolase / (4S)-4-hydroxy-2-oxoglutarate aldolase
MLPAEAVHAGGVSIVEVTMTVPGPIEVIDQLSKSIGKDMLSGAGVVQDAATTQQCIDA